MCACGNKLLVLTGSTHTHSRMTHAIPVKPRSHNPTSNKHSPSALVALPFCCCCSHTNIQEKHMHTPASQTTISQHNKQQHSPLPLDALPFCCCCCSRASSAIVLNPPADPLPLLPPVCVCVFICVCVCVCLYTSSQTYSFRTFCTCHTTISSTVCFGVYACTLICTQVCSQTVKPTAPSFSPALTPPLPATAATTPPCCSCLRLFF